MIAYQAILDRYAASCLVLICRCDREERVEKHTLLYSRDTHLLNYVSTGICYIQPLF